MDENAISCVCYLGHYGTDSFTCMQHAIFVFRVLCQLTNMHEYARIGNILLLLFVSIRYGLVDAYAVFVLFVSLGYYLIIEHLYYFSCDVDVWFG